MSFLVKKDQGQLKFVDYGGYDNRNPSTIWCIKEADKIYNWPDFKEIEIHTEDFEQNIDQYTYSKKNSFVNLIPDFNFHCWAEVGLDDYEKYCELIHLHGKEQFEINKVGWIGNLGQINNRILLYKIGQQNKDIMDIISMKWFASNTTKCNYTQYISTPDLVKKYAILIDIEGNGYSGRLKYLLWSHRPLLLVDRPHKEYFFEFLKEWVHYIPVKRDLSDLCEKTQWCIDNYEQALIIAENAYNFSREFLTREGCYKQWNKIIEQVIRNQ